MVLDTQWINYLSRAPLFLVLLGGTVYALMTWNRHRTVSLLAVLGCLILLVLQVGGPVLTSVIISQMHRNDAPVTKITNALWIMDIINSLAVSGGMACLLGAAFGWRKSATPHP